MPLQCLCSSKRSFLFKLFHVFFLIVVVATGSLVGFAKASTSSVLLKHPVVVKASAKSAAANAGRKLASSRAVSASATITTKARAAARARASVGGRATATTAPITALSRLRKLNLKLPVNRYGSHKVVTAIRPSTSAAAATISTGATTTARPPLRSVFQRTPGWINRGATTTNPATNTGFKQFSQRATRLQNQLQKSFSLRAIFSDVITNHPGQQKPSKPVSTSSRRMMEDESNTLLSGDKKDAVSDMFVLQDALKRIVTGTIQESWGGFVGGYGLAMTTDVAKKVGRWMLQGGGVRPAAAAATTTAPTTAAATAATAGGHILPYPSFLRHSQRSLQMHSRYVQFGMEWAQMSAVFGACRLLVQSVRRSRHHSSKVQQHHQDDEWDTITGSALAGAVFACSYKQGRLHLPPVAMTRGAILYGGTMLLLHPHLWWKQGLQSAADNLQQSLSMPTPEATMQTPMMTTTGNHPCWDGME